MTAPAPRDVHGRLHPLDADEVAALVRAARATGRRLRVRGAGHSVPAVIAGRDDEVLVLDHLRGLTWDGDEVTVGAGARFGRDPLDPRALARDTGVCEALHARGRALPNLGGVLHQTVGGFLATGSAGGSATHDLAAAVVALHLVDGAGVARTLRRGEAGFEAALVGLGLLGVVVAVTFRTEPAYDVQGEEVVIPDAAAGVDLYADGATGLAAFLARTPYARVLWWPQRGVRRLVVWSARRVAPDAPGAPARYHPMPPVLGTSWPTQAAAGAALYGLTHAGRALARLGAPGRLVRRALQPSKPPIYRAFVDVDTPPVRFRGPWHEILPQDAAMDERLMPTTFTEVFVPLDRAAEAMRRLRDAFDATPDAAGRFAIELYAAPPSDAWLSPTAGRASLRVNVFWLQHAPEDPRDAFFPRLWEALAPLDARLHWGKLLPHRPAEAVVGRYPRLDDFLAVRAAADPDGVFLADWHRAALGLAGPDARPEAPLPGPRAPRLPVRWPLAFALDPSDADLLDRADHVFDLRAVVRGEPDDVLRSLFDLGPGSGVPGLVGLTWHTEAGRLDDAVVDEAFTFMTLRLRTVHHAPGRRLVMSVDRCTWPLGRQVVEVFDAVPVAEGTALRWRVGVTFAPVTAALAPLLLPGFEAFFRATLAAVGRRAGREAA